MTTWHGCKEDLICLSLPFGMRAKLATYTSIDSFHPSWHVSKRLFANLDLFSLSHTELAIGRENCYEIGQGLVSALRGHHHAQVLERSLNECRRTMETHLLVRVW